MEVQVYRILDGGGGRQEEVEGAEVEMSIAESSSDSASAEVVRGSEAGVAVAAVPEEEPCISGLVTMETVAEVDLEVGVVDGCLEVAGKERVRSVSFVS